jgi:sulfur carrier protein
VRSSSETAPLEVTLNGEPQHLPLRCTVERLLAILGMEGRRVAVARNRCVVPRSAFAKEPLENGDRVEILEAVGGGA